MRLRATLPSSADALVHVALLGAMWGCGFLFIKVSLEAFTPVEITFGRLAVGALVLQALLLVERPEHGWSARRPRRLWLLLVLLAVLANVVPNTLIAWSVADMPTTAAAITNATTPLFTAVLAMLVALEPRPGPRRAAGIVLGFAGVGLMFGFGFSGGSVIARVALLAAAFAYACAFVLAGARSFSGVSLVWLSAMQLTVGALLMLPSAFASVATDPPEPRLGALAALLALGLFTTGLATVVYLRAVRRIGATSASLATYLVPIVGAALGFVFLGERLGPLAVVGAAVTATGIVLAERTRGSALRQVA